MVEEYFKDFFIHSPIPYSIQEVIFDEEGKPDDYLIIDYNPASEELMKDQLMGTDMRGKRFYQLYEDGWKGQEQWQEEFQAAILARKPASFVMNHFTIEKWLRVEVFPIRGNVYAFVYNDITKEMIQEKEITSFLKINIDMLCVLDQQGRFMKINKAFKRILGYDEHELTGQNFIFLVHEEDIEMSRKALADAINRSESTTRIINQVIRKDGAVRTIEWHLQLIGKYVYASARDITEYQILNNRLYKSNEELKKLTRELQNKNEILQKLAVTDKLTGLYNRYFLDIWIESEMKDSDMRGDTITLVIADLDHFKKINDTWGHPVGDQVLKEMAQFLLKYFCDASYVFRLGGEEFGIILPNKNLHESFEVIDQIRLDLETHTFSNGIKVTASFGIAEKGKFELFKDWYKRADDALYIAKKTGRNKVVCLENT